MALIKTQKIDKVEFVGDWKRLQVRHKIEIKEDDVVVSSSYHRNAYDISVGIDNLPEELKPYATGVWTAELVSEYEAYAAEQYALTQAP